MFGRISGAGIGALNVPERGSGTGARAFLTACSVDEGRMRSCISGSPCSSPPSATWLKLARYPNIEGQCSAEDMQT